MSKRTQRKSLDYEKKSYIRTRTMPGNWYLTSYNFKFNLTHMKPFLDKLKQKKLVGLKCPGCNRVFFPPRLVCGKCLIKPDQWVDLRETGQVSTFAIAYLKENPINIFPYPFQHNYNEKEIKIFRGDFGRNS